MLILALDTSAGTSVALIETIGSSGSSGTVGAIEVRAARASDDARHHAEFAAPMIAQALAEAGADPAGIGLVVAGTGPAPFTGLRVGLVTARAFARARGIEVAGVPSLDALARTVLDAPALDGGEFEEIVVATDARRREVYAARYRADGADDVHTLAGPLVRTPAEALAAVGGRGLPVAGAGTELYPRVLAPAGLPGRIDPAALVRVALARRAARDAGQNADLGTEPLYLRRPDVHAGGTRGGSRG